MIGSGAVETVEAYANVIIRLCVFARARLGVSFDGRTAECAISRAHVILRQSGLVSALSAGILSFCKHAGNFISTDISAYIFQNPKYLVGKCTNRMLWNNSYLIPVWNELW